jgi:hypothetical protein
MRPVSTVPEGERFSFVLPGNAEGDVLLAPTAKNRSTPGRSRKANRIRAMECSMPRHNAGIVAPSDEQRHSCQVQTKHRP